MLDRFAELGVVDDAAYARGWVESRHNGRGLSRRALRFELRRKGVADDTIDAALQQVDCDDEREAARRLVRARLPGLTQVDATTQHRRLLGLLSRRGYSPAAAASAVRDVVGEAPAEDFGP